MDHGVLSGHLGRSRVDDWYEEIKDDYAWNARYWEQRALFLSQQRKYDRAESYATNAVSKHRDPFTLNTLGTVLMRKSVEWYHPVGSSESLACLERGITALRQARLGEVEEQEHPYSTFFRWALKFAESAWFGAETLEGDGGRSLLEQEWSTWIRAARSVELFTHTEFRDDLERMNGEWLKLRMRLDNS